MIYEALAIQGFRSFVGDHAFHFPQGDGVYFIGGDNQEEPELGPNACGKSSLWDALCWVLYGKSTRGQKAGDVANWSGEFATVCALDFEIRGVRYSVTRAWNPNVRTLQVENDEPRVVEQADIDELVGLNFDRFLTTVVMSQFGKPFLELKKPDKLAAFARVLGIDEWLDKSDAAKQDEERLDRTLKHLRDNELAEMSTIEADRKSWDDAVLARDRWAEELTRRVSIAEEHCENTLRSMLACESDALALDGARAELSEWLRMAEVDANRRIHRLRNLDEDLRGLHEQGRTLYEQIERERSSLEAINGMIGRCPTCRQRVSDAHARTVIANIAVTLEQATPKLRIIDADVLRIGTQRTQLNKHHQERQAGMSAQRNALNRTDRDLSRAKERVDGTKRASEQAATSLSDAQQAPNPHQTTADRLLARMRDTDRRVVAIQESIGDVEQGRDLATYWKQHFKDLRLWICEQAMAEFSAVMNGVMEQLGLIGWSVRADLERQTKGGSIQRGFQLFIRSPKSPEWVPLESWSGGETQRLMLAGNVAFSDLECGRSGYHPSIEVWDEPTKHLSAHGVQALMEYLQTRARRLHRQIFLVDHRTIESGQFAGSYTVIMDHNGSRIEGEFKQKASRELMDQGASSRRCFPTAV